MTAWRVSCLDWLCVCSRVALHGVRGGNAQQTKAVGDDLPGCFDQVQACIADFSILNPKGVGVVIGVEIVGQFTQVMRQLMRFMVNGCRFQDFRITRKINYQLQLMGL